ncbi:hypothetical protein CsSME_00018941 [Camellia sinensis var. sinensis]
MISDINAVISNGSKSSMQVIRTSFLEKILITSFLFATILLVIHSLPIQKWQPCSNGNIQQHPLFLVSCICCIARVCLHRRPHCFVNS